MNTAVDLNKILKKGNLDNELDFERATVINRKLRVLEKEHPELAEKRQQLHAILKEYENRVWVNNQDEITPEKIAESEMAEMLADQEQFFFHRRKELIRNRLKYFSLTQKDLGKLLGHSNTYISELVNGIYPFTMHDLTIIRLLLKIDFKDLIPTVLNTDDRTKLASVVRELSNPKLAIDEQSLELISC